jgi:hypothetical protein
MPGELTHVEVQRTQDAGGADAIHRDTECSLDCINLQRYGTTLRHVGQ